MAQSLHSDESYLIRYSEGDRSFAVVIRAASFPEAKRMFSRMSRDERRRHIVSTMAVQNEDVLGDLFNWFRRTFAARA